MKASTRGAPKVPAVRPRADKDPVSSYAWDVLHGRIIACRYVRLACERHFLDLEHAAARKLIWSPVAANYVCSFFGLLRHSKGEWGKGQGEQVRLEPWQKFVVGSVFGWFNFDGTRRFRQAWIEVPRKNGKTFLMSGVGIYCLIGDDEPGAEIYAAATKLDQARLIFDEARRMVRKAPTLRSQIGIFKDNLSVDATASKFEPLSSDDGTLDGLNPSAVLLDEVHKHKSRALLDVLDTAVGARRQPLIWLITTAGSDLPETVYATENDYYTRVLERTISAADGDQSFAYITGVDADDRWDDPMAWRKANPNYGISVKPGDLKRMALKAKHSPSALTEFKRLRLNLRTPSADRYIDMDLWRRNSVRPVELHAAAYRAERVQDLVGRRFFGALDMSSKIDLSAWIKLFPPVSEGERWSVICHFWMPGDTVAEKSDRDRVQYQRWINEGWVEATMGNVIDHNEIQAAIEADCRTFNPAAIAFDPMFATQLSISLGERGLPVFEFIQGLRSYSAPCRELDAWLVGQKLDHGDNPVLDWMAGNLRVHRGDNETMRPTKALSTGRIDGMTALIMAIGRSMADDGGLYGDGRGLLVLR